jgi:hypothetical protein
MNSIVNHLQKVEKKTPLDVCDLSADYCLLSSALLMNFLPLFGNERRLEYSRVEFIIGCTSIKGVITKDLKMKITKRQ